MSSREQEDIGKGSESMRPYETYVSRTSNNGVVLSGERNLTVRRERRGPIVGEN